jgi:hypothetical protein
MTLDWKLAFTEAEPAWLDGWTLESRPNPQNPTQLKQFLDQVHIKHCLMKPFAELSDYPLVETRELLPSFESDLWEHERLPGFSLVALARPIDYFREVFQFDLLHPIEDNLHPVPAQERMSANLGVMQSRLPRSLQENIRLRFVKEDVTSLALYPQLMSYLVNMDRAQVFGMHGDNPQERRFYLAGVYASLPSDLDTEVKRYGLRIGKFSLDDPDSYERNRNFVCRHLMELYGFPVASERRTSAALFARRLHKMGEKFLIRTVSQSDRTITTIWNDGTGRPYPLVEKLALVSVDEDHELLPELLDQGFLLDARKRVVILRVRYKQHKFSPDNVRQERAISVESQEVVHPLTGKPLTDVGIIRDTANMFLRLNDIVRGEHTGRIIYKRSEIVENTDTEEKRLKFLYAWLSKHQRRIIGYREEFFANIEKILDGYLLAPEHYERFAGMNELYLEVIGRYSYIQQARKIRVLEELQARTLRGARVSYNRMLLESVTLLHSLKFEIVSYFDTLVGTVIAIGDGILNDSYLRRTYIDKPDETLTTQGVEVKKNYGKLVALIDHFKAIRKSKQKAGRRGLSPFQL